ncbi:MAG: Ni/Fe-hydrogenase cytochrome b subunit [Gemmatimonadota bacterium]|nr:Ni/Fe-hydrogenase cytochrome b subunit [Gemmatimonadota bacterium]
MKSPLECIRSDRLGLGPSCLLIIALVLVFGLVLSFRRFFFGLGAVTALNDYQPWGLWVGFDVICGVALAAGGFVLTALVFLLNYEHYKPMLRATVLTAFLGYAMEGVGLFFDLGKPWNIWHPIIMWNPQSVMFVVAWCVMLIATFLALGFSPAVLDKFALTRARKLVRAFTTVLVLAGILLSIVHQSSLGTLFLIVPGKLHPLWYSPLLPLHFFLSAVTVGFAMVIVESSISHSLFRKSLDTRILAELGQFMLVCLAITLAVRFQDLWHRVEPGIYLDGSLESWAFLLENACFILPLALMTGFRNRMKRSVLLLSAALTVLAVVINRLNVSITGLARSGQYSYFPTLEEFGVSLFLVASGFIVFILCLKYFPVFPREETDTSPRAQGRELKHTT